MSHSDELLAWALRRAQEDEGGHEGGQARMAAFRYGPSGLSSPPVTIHMDEDGGKGCSLWLDHEPSSPPVNAHDVVFTETADHSYPDLSRMRSYVSANSQDGHALPIGCSQCLKSLSKPESCYANRQPRGIEGARGGDEEMVLLPLTDQHWPSILPSSCACNCGDIYCSETCKATAWRQHHQALCPSLADKATQDDRGNLGRLESFCLTCLPLRISGELRMAPLLLARAAASELIRRRNEAQKEDGTTRPLKLLEGYALMPGGGKQLRFSYQTQALHQLTCKALGIGWESHHPQSLPSPSRGFHLTLDDYEEGLGRVFVNSLVLKPKSTFSQYFSALRNSFMSSEEREKLLDQILSVARDQGTIENRRDSPAYFESRTSTSGIGIFRLMSKCNHECCSPSCEAQSFGFLDHTIDLVARRRVRAKEELTISYLDLKKDADGSAEATQRRRRQLQESYGFKCSCKACSMHNEQGGD